MLVINREGISTIKFNTMCRMVKNGMSPTTMAEKPNLPFHANCYDPTQLQWSGSYDPIDGIYDVKCIFNGVKYMLMGLA